MLEIRKSDTYEQWFRQLKDRQARTRINARIRCIEEFGHFGDVKPARESVSEMRIDYGPGYRIYFMQRGFCVGGVVGWWRQEHARFRHQAGNRDF